MSVPRSSHPGLLSHLITFTALATIAGLTAVGMISSRYGWPQPLELLSHFQGQYLILSGLLLGVLVLTQRIVPLAIAVALVGLLSTQVIPWYLSVPSALGDNGDSMRVVLANLNTRNRDYGKLLRFAQDTDPDLLFLMEVSDTWFPPLEQLKGALPYGFSRRGNVLLSRYPLEQTRADRFSARWREALLAQITIEGQPIALVGAHPPPPVRLDIFHERNRHLDGIAQHIRSLSMPVILMGDFNVTMWSPYYQRLTRLTGLRNTRQGFGLLPSWPTAGTFSSQLDWAALILSIPIDHCLTSPEFQVLSTRTGPNIGSDHRPVVVDLSRGKLVG